MRPLLLRMRGFRSYRDEATFDFAERSLIGVVGPTGAGKSTILDAVAFALYGRTPAEGRASSRLLHATSESGHVELWFESGGEILRVARSIRQRGQATQSLSRHDGVGGELIETIATSVAEILAEVEERLGLDFEAFRRSVLLAQNQFSELLVASPAEAEKVLSGLFGFGEIEQMRELATARRSERRAELAVAERARENLEEDRRKLEAAERELAVAEATSAAFEAVSEEFAAVSSRLTAIETEAMGLKSERGRLERLALPTPEAVTTAVGTATTRAERLAEAEARRRTAVGALEAARTARDEAVEQRLAALATSLLDRRDTLAARRRDLEGCEAETKAATEAVETSAAGFAAAETAAAAAVEAVTVAVSAEAATRDALDSLRLAHSAHALADTLVVGEACPVCTRPVEALPERASLTVVEDAEASLQAAVSAVSDARKAQERAARSLGTAASARDVAVARLDAAETQLAAVRRECDTLAAAITTAEQTLTRMLGNHEGDVAAAALARWEAVEEGWGAANSEATAAAEELERLRDEPDALGPLVQAVHTVVSHLELPTPDTNTPDAVGAAVTDLRTELDRRLSTLSARQQALDEERADLNAERLALLGRVDLTDPSAFPAAHAAAQVESAKATALVTERRAQVSRQEQAVAESAGVAAEADRLDRLVRHLGSSGFPQYLLDERRRELAATASERFRQLSGDRYGICLVDEDIAERFGLGRTEINRFAIRDFSLGGRVRSAGTLSGGETFLASLALALGLATLVAADGGVLDAFFVDEGFGSLDADSLDLAMEGIELLVAERPDRLVVVVSHVPEMRERIPDLIVLGRLPGDGGTEVVRA